MGRGRVAGSLAAVAVAWVIGVMPGDAAALAPRDCSVYAAVGAAPGGDGSTDHPFATAQQLINAVGPGQTGCLGPGVYTENVVINRSAPIDKPITITATDP